MIVVYLGPSLSIEKARSILDADYRAPIKRGDIRKAMKDGATVIGIIDGVFYSKSPVVHKEILAALKKKITVVGGSSMGALRASELDVFGMIGVGRVYECYRSGRIVADDEVAVTYSPVTGEQMSEPLVNVRFQLKAACDEGVITSDERSALLSMISEIHYPERIYSHIADLAVEKHILNDDSSKALLAYIARKPLNLKAEDAIATLRKIKELSSPVSPGN